ncbi:hypothetical protein [Methylobacter sp. YRD-M1]|uniref:hypothetical protein n=1 Tax=Methylobacter sp. YRD-M1 TaxID=2911520 RepID=UPI00227B6E49|nr:hypothetical protein [Methylobacter sp. YRD-M1]WAK00276.1 hypothetical protein LZ558_10415 [Methylobacter sp. YRD-M1]
MEIHNSSLTFSPIGYNRQSVERNSNLQNKDEISELSVPINSHNHQFGRGLSADETKKAFDNAGLILGLIDQHNTYKSTDTRTLKALNAYMQNQLTLLITGIDTYV